MKVTGHVSISIKLTFIHSAPLTMNIASGSVRFVYPDLCLCVYAYVGVLMHDQVSFVSANESLHSEATTPSPS